LNVANCTNLPFKQRITYTTFPRACFSHDTNYGFIVDGFTDFVQQLFPQWLRENIKNIPDVRYVRLAIPFLLVATITSWKYIAPHSQNPACPSGDATGISNHPAFALYRVIHTMSPF